MELLLVAGYATAAEPDGAIRIALLAGSVPRLRDATCRRSAAAQTLVLTLGHEALVFVVPSGRPMVPLDSVTVFRAFGAAAPRGTAAAAGTLLAPAAGTPSDALLGAMVLEHGCVTALPMGAVPHAAAARSVFCAALSEGNNVVRRRPGSAAEGVAQIRAWAASAPAGAIAAISLAEWIELTGVVTPVPLDGVLPTAANLAAGIYPASRQIKLAFVVPRAASQPARNAALDHMRRVRCRPVGTADESVLFGLPDERRPERYREIAEALEVALRQFGPRERRMVRQLIDGESYGAIAAREGISLNALKVRIHRLRLVLRISVRAAQEGVVSTDGAAAGRVAA